MGSRCFTDQIHTTPTGFMTKDSSRPQSNASAEPLEQDGSSSIGGPDVQIVLLLILTGLILRLVYIYLIRDHLLFHETVLKAEWFRDWALNLHNGNPVWTSVPEYMPLYGYLQYALIEMTRTQSLWPLYALQTVLGLGSAVLVWALARRLFGHPVDKLSLAFFLFFPDWIVLETRPVPAVLFVFLVLLSVYLLIRGTESRPDLRFLIPASVTVGLGFLTHIAGGVMIVLFGFLLIFRGGWSAKQRLTALAITMTPALLFLAAVLVSNHRALLRHYPHGGLILPSDTGRQLYAANGPEATGSPPFQPGVRDDRIRNQPMLEKVSTHPVRVEQFYLRETGLHLFRHPISFLETLLHKGYYLITSYTIDTFEPVHPLKQASGLFAYGLYPFGLLLLFGGYGAWTAFSRRRTYRILFWSGFVLLLLLITFAPDARSRLSLIPFLAIFAGEGCMFTAGCVNSGRWRSLLSFLPFFLLMLAGFLPVLNSPDAERKAFRTPIWQAAAQWRNDPEEALNTLDRARKTSHWARNPYVHFRYAEYVYRFDQLKDQGAVAGTPSYNVLGSIKSVTRLVEEQNLVFPAAYDLLGQYYLDQNNTKLALRHYRRALNMAPAPDRWSAIGEALIQANRYEKAVEEMNGALERFPHCDVCRINLARALSLRITTRLRRETSNESLPNPERLLQKQDYRNALRQLRYVYRRATEARTTNVAARAAYLSGYLYERSGQFEEARDQFRRARDRGGQYAEKARKREREMWLDRAERLIEEEQYADAVTGMNRALNALPDCEQCRLKKARALFKDRKFEESLEVLGVIIRNTRKQNRRNLLARAIFLTGYIYEGTNHPRKALEYYREAKKMDGPLTEQAGKRIESLKSSLDEKNGPGSATPDSEKQDDGS